MPVRTMNGFYGDSEELDVPSLRGSHILRSPRIIQGPRGADVCSFAPVVSTTYGERSRTRSNLLGVSADPAEGSPLQTLLQLTPPQPPPRRQSCTDRASEATACSRQNPESHEGPPSPSGPAVPPPGLILEEGRAPGERRPLSKVRASPARVA